MVPSSSSYALQITESLRMEEVMRCRICVFFFISFLAHEKKTEFICNCSPLHA